MRVIAGSARGRRLQSVPGSGTRPILDRIKESLFNILNWDINGAHFLDLFAGTGSVGIEALSRGAEQAVFVEKDRKAIKVITQNLHTTRLIDQAAIVQRDVFSFISDSDQLYDLIFLAPPQYKMLWADTLLAIDRRPSLLSKDGTIIAQIDPKEYQDLPLQNLLLTDSRTYGNTMLCFYSHTVDEVL